MPTCNDTSAQLHCEHCQGEIHGAGRYYPGSAIAHQPSMERVCKRCGQILKDAVGLALQAKYAAPVAPAPPARPVAVVTPLAYEMLARTDKARLMAKLLYRGGIPSQDVSRMTSEDWQRFHAGLKTKGVVGPHSTISSAETIAMVIVEMRRLERLAPPPVAARIRRRVAA